MSTLPTPATGTVTVRLPLDLIARLDALARATERNRSYWVHQAVSEVIERELWQIAEIEEALAEDDAHPERGMTAAEFDQWMIEHGLTSREALDRAEAALRHEQP